MHIIYHNVDTDHQYITADRVAYFCKVYYENVASLEWSVKLSIVRRLKALEEVHLSIYICVCVCMCVCMYNVTTFLNLVYETKTS